MSKNLLSTKFFAPPRPADDISRAHLAKRLDEGLASKLTLVCAAAGFGKSTLISQWAQDCPYPSAWLSLDEDDRDSHRFLEYVLASLEVISQTVGAGLVAMLQASPPSSAETVLTLLVNQLATIHGRLVLVLDDYHLAASKAVNDALAFLIEHMPAQLHLIVASREEPEIPLGKLRVKGQLNEIRQHELRFGMEETAEFFSRGLKLKLSKPQVNALEARTEGWIAGLKLAALSLRAHEDPAAFIESFTGSHRFVQDYLIEEVLHQQSAEVQSFLLRTSVLNRLSGPLCDAVLESQGGQEILDQLDAANLFIVPLDTDRRWYRYHHLFSELLRHRLSQKEPAAPLHLRASLWYEAQGMELEAFHQATLAHDLPIAIRMIEGNGMPLYFRGTTAPLVQWLSALPQATLNSHPSLWVTYSWSLLFAGHPGQVEEKLLGAEAALLAAHPAALGPDMAGDIEGQIAVLWAWLAVYRNEPDSIYAHASRALELLNPDDRPARTAAHCARGVAQMFRGELAEAQVAFSKVIGAGRSSGNLMFAAVAATALAGIQTTRYQLHLAAASYREVIGMISDPSHVLGFEAHLGLATILVDWNELDEAESLALLCSELVSRAKSQTELGADLLRARLMLASNEHVEAEALLSRTDATLKAGPLTDRMREAADLRVQHFLRRGELNKAADLAETYQVPLGLARTKLARGEARDALRILQEHRRSMEAQARTQDALKAAVVEVMVLRAMGSVALALQTLRECLTLAQDQGSVRLFVEEGAPMKKLLAPLQQEAAFGRFVSRLLGAFETRAGREEGAAATLEPDSANMPYGAFSLRELEILRLIQEGLSNQNICDRLFLSLSTVKWHNQNIFAKLDVQRRTEAVARALQLKLL